MPLYSSNKFLNVVIEIPAGTNKKYEYNYNTEVFELDKINGKDRIVQYLPYLGNYCYILSTYSDPKEGGDGDALDVLVLSESVETGTVMEVIPVAILKLIDDGELDYKIIAVPANKSKQIVDVLSYNDLVLKYPEIISMIEFWFLNYNKQDYLKTLNMLEELKWYTSVKNH